MGADKRFSITMSDDLYQQVDDFRHDNKYTTQTKAIADLVRKGLQTLSGKIDGVTDGTTDMFMSAYHKSLMDSRRAMRGTTPGIKVIGLPEPQIPPIPENAIRLLEAYDALSPNGQEQLLDFANYLLHKEKNSESPETI